MSLRVVVTGRGEAIGKSKRTHKHDYFLKHYKDKRAIFDIVENNRTKEYVFRGVFEYDMGELTENKRIWNKTTDFLDVPSQKKVIDADPFGEIYIIGAIAASKNDIFGVARAEGISPNRISIVDYDEAKTFERDLVGKTQVCVVFLGPTPHKTVQTGSYSSLITSLEDNSEEIPATLVRLSTSGNLKITKSNLKDELKRLITIGRINRDNCIEAST